MAVEGKVARIESESLVAGHRHVRKCCAGREQMRNLTIYGRLRGHGVWRFRGKNELS